jgi:DNA recombination protein RmuC
METTLLLNVLILIGIGAIIVSLLALGSRLRGAPGSPEIAAHLQSVSQSVSQGTIQAAAMAERLTQLEPVAKTLLAVHVELRGLLERLSTVEQSQSAASRGVGDLSAASASGFSELRAVASALSDATAAIRAELARTSNDLTEIKAHEKSDKELSARVAESVRRLETVIAGTQSKGAAGENILEQIFANLPLEWQVRDFKIGGKACEFGLRLPSNLILPIDSKWPATDLLERFAGSTSMDEQQRLQKDIEACVLAKARDVEKYLDPSVTMSMGVAVVPDAVYDLCPGARVDAFAMNVAVISYSMFTPYLLLVYQTALSGSQTVDMQKLVSFLGTIEKVARELHDEIDGRLSPPEVESARGFARGRAPSDRIRFAGGRSSWQRVGSLG